MQTILIVEDEKRMRDAVAIYLRRAGFHTIEAENGKEAIALFNEHDIDLVVLDVMLPLLDGWTVLRSIRQVSNVFVIMLTALEEEYDKLQGFELGADEYVTKPFSPKVLAARVKAMLTRKPQQTAVEKIKVGGLLLDKKSHEIVLDGEALLLTPKEYRIMEYFMQNENQALTREQILSHVWGYDFYGDARVVDTHVKNLRGKLKSAEAYIKTIKCVGYRFEVRDD
jgi:DNA-binding response OmpR family regulator